MKPLCGSAFAFKYRLYPTKPQPQFLDRELKEACSLYNAARQERDDAWKTCRKSINYYDRANQLKAMRADACLTLSNFSCGRDVLRRVDKTYNAFYARVKRGEKSSRDLVDEYRLIAVEDLNVKSVHDAGWAAFLDMLLYKAEDAGRDYRKFDARGTSQVCLCGAPVPETLAHRWHRARTAGVESGTGLTSGQPSGVNVEVVIPCV